jgi:hypothetical protein
VAQEENDAPGQSTLDSASTLYAHLLRNHPLALRLSGISSDADAEVLDRRRQLARLRESVAP